MSDEDRSAFSKAMQDVKPLQHEERVSTRKRPAPKARNARAARDGLLAESLGDTSGSAADEIEQLGEEMAFRRQSVPEKTFQRLRRGQFRIEAESDLHGLTVAEAKVLLREFICEAALEGIGCVRVIHGKGLRSGPGGPVLKGNVQRWLCQWEEVLAFVTARARDGGSGAVYVLLRRR